MARQQMAALCANAVGGFANQCLRIEAASFVLKRKHERRSVKVAFRPDDDQLQLRSDIAAAEPWCDGRCDVETPPVPQRLSVFDPRTTRELWSEEITLESDQRMQVTFSPDPDPEWPSTLGAVFNALGVGGCGRRTTSKPQGHCRCSAAVSTTKSNTTCFHAWRRSACARSARRCRPSAKSMASPTARRAGPRRCSRPSSEWRS